MSDEFDPVAWDDSKTDDAPQRVIVLSEGWLAYVRGSFERLFSENAWEAGVDWELIVEQLSDAWYRLLGGEAVAMIGFTRGVWVDIRQMEWLAASTRVWNFMSGAPGAGYFYPQSPYQYDQIVRFHVYMLPGDYALRGIYRAQSGQGIFEWLLNGVVMPGGGQFDLYSASDNPNYAVQSTFTIVAAGEYEFKLRNAGKNALSSGYYVNLNGVAIIQL